MNLSRRGLLGGLLAVVSAPAIVRVESLMVLPAKIIAPEPVLWLMEEKTTEVWASGNSLLTIEQITREAIKLFTNSNAFLQSLDEQYNREFATVQARIGDTLQIRLPTDFAIAKGHQFA